MTTSFTPLLPPQSKDAAPDPDVSKPAGHHRNGQNGNGQNGNGQNDFSDGHGAAAEPAPTPVIRPLPVPPHDANPGAAIPSLTVPPPQASPVANPQPTTVSVTATRVAVPLFSPVAFLQQHFLYLVLCGAIAGGIAWFGALHFVSYSHKFQSQLLYNRFGSEVLGYMSPNLTALTPLTVSRRVLDPTIEKLDLPCDAMALEDMIEVEVPYESSLFNVQLNWPNEDEGVAVLDEILQQFTRVVSATRRSSIERVKKGVDISLQDIERRIQNQRQHLQDFNNRHQVLDLDTELNALRVEIDLLDYRLTTTKHRLEGDEAKFARLSTTAGTTGDKSQAKNANKSLRMEEYRVQKGLLSDEETRLKQQADLEYQQRLFDIDKKLFESQLITQADFDASRHKLESLKSINHPSLSAMRDEVTSTENEIKQLIKSGDSSQFILASGTSLKSNVEMGIISGKIESTRLAELLERKQARLKELSENRMECQGYNEELKTLNAERVRFQQRWIDLQNLNVDETIEFTVVERPCTAINSLSSNRKKLLLGIFGCCLAVTVGPVLLRDVIKSQSAVAA